MNGLDLSLHSSSLKAQSAEEVMAQLKFLSKVEPHEKINTKTLTLCEENVFSKFQRYMNGESRQSTLEFIKDLLSQAVEMCFLYMQKDNERKHTAGEYSKKMASLMLETLEGSRKGIKNIALTYQDDRMFTSKLDIILKTMDINIERIYSLCKEENEKSV
jgi:hypothetical protein